MHPDASRSAAAKTVDFMRRTSDNVEAKDEPNRNNDLRFSVSRMTMTEDRLIQGMAGNGDFRILAAQTTNTVETAREILDLSPVAADALGRALTGSLLLARLLDKNLRNQYVTLRFEGDGPLGIVIAEGTVAGTARGFVENRTPEDLTTLD